MTTDYLITPPEYDVPDDLDGKPYRYVYLHMDANGDALYVGCTRAPLARNRWHAKHSPWFADVADTAWYPSPDAYRVETEINNHLDTPNNIKGTSRDPSRGPRSDGAS